MQVEDNTIPLSSFISTFEQPVSDHYRFKEFFLNANIISCRIFFIWGVFKNICRSRIFNFTIIWRQISTCWWIRLFNCHLINIIFWINIRKRRLRCVRIFIISLVAKLMYSKGKTFILSLFCLWIVILNVFRKKLIPKIDSLLIGIQDWYQFLGSKNLGD